MTRREQMMECAEAMEWISVNTDMDWLAEYDYCGCKWECLSEPPKEDV